MSDNDAESVTESYHAHRELPSGGTLAYRIDTDKVQGSTALELPSWATP